MCEAVEETLEYTKQLQFKEPSFQDEDLACMTSDMAEVFGVCNASHKRALHRVQVVCVHQHKLA